MEGVSALSESVKQLAELQNSQSSEWSVNGAAFIVVALFMIILFGSVFSVLIKSILNQQKQLTQKFWSGNDFMTKFQESFDKNTEVMDKVSNYLARIEKLSEDKAKRAINSEQLYYILKNTLESYKRKIYINSINIIEVNNISDTVKTKQKIDSFTKNLYNSFISGMNNFDYNGNKLGKLVVSNQETWIKEQKALILDYIYAGNDRDVLKFNNELDILFDTVFNDLRKIFNF